jgi:hypothetical protein
MIESLHERGCFSLFVWRERAEGTLFRIVPLACKQLYFCDNNGDVVFSARVQCCLDQGFGFGFETGFGIE